MRFLIFFGPNLIIRVIAVVLLLLVAVNFFIKLRIG
jgi:hypothetical protein